MDVESLSSRRLPDILSPEVRLALALARHRPCDRHLAHARQLVSEGINWTRMHALAIRNNVVPLLSTNLEALNHPDIPKGALTQLARDRERIRLGSMLLLSSQLSLINKVLVPRGVRFALLKGVGLSQRYYSDMFARHSQDIDLLVEAGRIAEVASTLVDAGWKVVNPDWRDHPLGVFARYNSVIEVQAPEGVRVELHKTLDNSGIVFDTARIFGRTSLLTVAGRQLPTLGVVDEFLYACFHHSRHGWSCLHWCADLPAMMDVPDFDTRVLQPARAHTLMRSTVEACVLLADNLNQIAAGAVPSDLAHKSPFLDACLQSVDRDAPPAPPAIVDPSLMEPDFPEDWQRSLSYRIRFALSRCRPNLNDYNAWPVNEYYRWVYWFTRPWRALARRSLSRSRVSDLR